jgi:hypothetical protein
MREALTISFVLMCLCVKHPCLNARCFGGALRIRDSRQCAKEQKR